MAFSSCDNLSNVILPQSLTEIQKEAFSLCKSLTEITYAGSKKQWGKVNKNSSWRDRSSLKVIHCWDGDVVLKEKAVKLNVPENLKKWLED